MEISSRVLFLLIFLQFLAYGSSSIEDFRQAFPIVEPDPGHTKLRLSREGLAAIERITTPIAAVSVIGPYRSGKSFLLNQLLSLSCYEGFGVGHMRDTKTKGIWVWGTPLEVDVDGVRTSVLYLDTEGFESVGKSNVYDDRIFALATVMSSVLIYNLPETIREADISRLSFAVELAEEFYGRVKGQDVAFEPAKLLWLIQRDFLQGKSVQEMVDEALKHVPNSDGDKNIDQVNQIRDSLAIMGDNSTGFSLPQPHLQRTKLCDMKDGELDELYVKKRDQLKELVASIVRPKIVQGRSLNGREFVSFLEQILEALNKGEIPSTGSLVEVFNKGILERCLIYNYFSLSISQSLNLVSLSERNRGGFALRSGTSCGVGAEMSSSGGSSSENLFSGDNTAMAKDKQKEKARVSRTSAILWHAHQNDAVAVRKLLEEDRELVHARDYDNRTPLHVASLHGWVDVAKCLIEYGADVNAQDRWKNTPLADAEGAKKYSMIELLKAYGGLSFGQNGSHFEPRPIRPPLSNKCDWEIDPSEIDFSNSNIIGKGSFGEILKACWRGTPVAVKRILPSLSDDRLVVQDFRHEVNLLVKLRHPNIVQFLGAVTDKKPLMLIIEYLRGGDLHQYLKEKGSLSPSTAINFALDIARGMAYLHNEPNVIVHRDLKPRNVLLVNSSANHLKVGDFGLSKLVKVQNSRDVYKMTGETGSYRYMAPEVFKHRKYDKKVDVFSFAMILYEMLEGEPPMANYEPYEAAQYVAEGHRPIFRAKGYLPELKELTGQCWAADMNQRPSFLDILKKLEKMRENLPSDHHWNIFTT